MCKDLLLLSNYVETIGAGSRWDVVRAACNRCDRFDVCVTVTNREFDIRSSTQDASFSDSNGADFIEEAANQ